MAVGPRTYGSVMVVQRISVRFEFFGLATPTDEGGPAA